MKNLKKFMVLAMTVVIVLTGLVACGKTAKKLTKEEYVAEITKFQTEVASKMGEAITGGDLTTDEGKKEIQGKINDTVIPLYETVGKLNAPDEFKTEQEAIKKGVDASIELLKVVTDETKSTEVNTKYTEELANMSAAIQTIVAAGSTEAGTTGEATTAK